ncbi:hypothetical protein OH76DRAFT_1259826 [Lentinus brumalis]|uniref:non-specific serine/threonine protein kinase n=1 Tax=Lentinus brumalis TaxID=2498619 RepID=A0A371CRF9_9APHY|nr:hypothetical protein OH76DRAFT_1259826 [Polyporus brumalis]
MTSATRNRTYYTLQDDNDFPIRPTFLLPQVDSQDLRSNTDSDGDDFCSRRAHPRCVSQPQSRPSPPTATSDQGASVSNLASSTYAPSGDTFCVQVGADSGDSPRVPPGLGLDDDLATYCTALNLCESSSWPIDEDFAVIGSSGSLQHLTPATQDPNVARLSLSTLSFLGTVGRGGYGKVLLAEAASSTRVAVKVLGKAGLTRDDAQEVKTEVRMLRMLSAMDDSCLGSAFTQRMHAAFQTKEHVFVILVRPLGHLN